jgi:hypothetical protein
MGESFRALIIEKGKWMPKTARDIQYGTHTKYWTLKILG